MQTSGEFERSKSHNYSANRSILVDFRDKSSEEIERFLQGCYNRVGISQRKESDWEMKKKLHWSAVLTLECLLLGIAAALLALTEWLPVVVSNICLWTGYPLAAAFTAYAATRKGLNNYAAWIPAPVMYAAAYYLVWGYLSSAGPMLISALTAIIGAAAGETKNQFERRRHK